MASRDTRSPLARAAGLGSSRSGTAHWLAERVSAIALVPLTLWFMASIIARFDSDHGAFTAWLSSPLPALLMILLLVALFHHTALGMQVVIEDYVHSKAKLPAVLFTRFVCFAGAAAGILATLIVALRG